MNYIGMDAHSKTCTFVVLDERGKEVASQKIPTNEKLIVQFIRSLKGGKKLAFEESNLSAWLHGILHREVDELVICNPSYMVRRKGSKGDYLDAQHLAQQLRGGFLTPVVHEENFFFQLRTVISSYEGLVEEIVRLKSRYKALFRSQACETRGTKIYGRAERYQELRGEMHQFVAQELFSRLLALEKVKKTYHERFETWVKAHKEIDVLDSIPSVGRVRACMIAAYVGTPYRFANKHKFWSYCELVRHDRVSDGESYGKKRIPANRQLKDVFMGAAQSAIEHSSSLKGYYEGMLQKGLDEKAARKNVARKIAAISLALMKSKKRYDDQILKTSEISVQGVGPKPLVCLKESLTGPIMKAENPNVSGKIVDSWVRENLTQTKGKKTIKNLNIA